MKKEGKSNWPEFQKVNRAQKIALLAILLFTTFASQFSDEVHYAPIHPSSDIRKFQAFLYLPNPSTCYFFFRQNAKYEVNK